MDSARFDAHGFTLDFKIVIEKLGMHVEASFDQPDIFIASAEQALDAAVNAYAGFHGLMKKRFLAEKQDARGVQMGEEANLLQLACASR